MLKPKSLTKLASELKSLTVDYAKQETITPLKSLGRFLAMGLAGSAFLSIGFLFWILAVLRALQNETGDHLTDHLSWVPYLGALAFSLVVIAMAISAIGADRRRAEKRKQEAVAASAQRVAAQKESAEKAASSK